MKYNHNYQDGDIVTDIECSEIFVFSNKTDGYKAEHKPKAFRLATEEEKKLLADSGETCISI